MTNICEIRMSDRLRHYSEVYRYILYILLRWIVCEMGPNSAIKPWFHLQKLLNFCDCNGVSSSDFEFKSFESSIFLSSITFNYLCFVDMYFTKFEISNNFCILLFLVLFILKSLLLRSLHNVTHICSFNGLWKYFKFVEFWSRVDTDTIFCCVRR